MHTPIIPALMPETFDDIEEMVSLVVNHVDMVQLDLMDGKYVPEKTWPFYHENDHNLASLIREDVSLPFWENINYELDLMVERPEENLDTWLHIGASRVIFHYASVHDWNNIRNIDNVVRDFIQIGCAITIHDDIEKVYPLIDEQAVDFIQVMGIAHIGYQGEPFEEQTLEIITTLRTRYPDLLITVDGGVSVATIRDLSLAGADTFVSGSGVFGGGVVSENIADLLEHM
ncbi:hypothetical protein KC901_01870 [Patescibacteria group bacterium]|nr:hypothetical protein [Patescibacteria group bacterium]